MPRYHILLTVTPFADFSLLFFAAQLPSRAFFHVAFGPEEMIERLGAWKQASPSQAIGLLRVLNPTQETEETFACVQFVLSGLKLGHLHFHPPSLSPQLLCDLEVCERLFVEMHLRISDPFATLGQQK